MFWTILALLLMVVLGGFISYYGDLQGRRWGKRRVSKFGLRPKHTAVLITTLTGGFIALLSIITVFIAFPTVQKVVLYGERAIDENKRLNVSLIVERKTQAQKFAEQAAQYKTEQARVQSELATDRSELAADRGLLARSKSDLEAARKEIAPKQAAIARLQATQAALQATLAQKRIDIARKSADLQEKIAENRRVEEYGNGLIKQFNDKTKQNGQLSASIKQLEQINKERQQEQARLTQNVTQVTGAIERIRKQGDFLDDNNRSIQADLARRQADIGRKQAELDKVNRQLDQAYTQLAGAEQAFTQNYHALRQGEINIRAGAELSRRTLSAHLSQDEARRQITQLLEDASDTAEGVYGAARGANKRAVRIISKRVVTPRDMQETDEADSLNALAENIAASSQPVVVVANSLNNCVRGEQALVELHPFEVRRVFDKNEVVAVRVINASQPPERVTEAITEFLQQDVRGAAVRAGSIPRVNPTTGSKEVGVFNSVALGQLTARVRRMGGNVQLRAVALVPTTSADPLDSAHLGLQTAPARVGMTAQAEGAAPSISPSRDSSPILRGFSGK